MSYVLKTFDNSYGRNPPELDALLAREDIQIHSILAAAGASATEGEASECHYVTVVYREYPKPAGS